MLEISTSGLMSGDGKRSGALQSTATAPVLDSTQLATLSCANLYCPPIVGVYDLNLRMIGR
jgi:hypothetical protein